MLKKIIPFILIFCLLFVTVVMAEDVPQGRGTRTQGGPPEGFTGGNGQFTPPEGFDPSQMPDFSNFTPPESFDPDNAKGFNTSGKTEAPAAQADAPVEEKEVATPTEEVAEQNIDSKNNGMTNRQSNRNGGMFNQQQNTTEQPTGFWFYAQKYFTPVISVVLLILAFVFVIFYKRKQY